MSSEDSFEIDRENIFINVSLMICTVLGIQLHWQYSSDLSDSIFARFKIFDSPQLLCKYNEPAHWSHFPLIRQALLATIRQKGFKIFSENAFGWYASVKLIPGSLHLSCLLSRRVTRPWGILLSLWGLHSLAAPQQGVKGRQNVSTLKEERRRYRAYLFYLGNSSLWLCKTHNYPETEWFAAIIPQTDTMPKWFLLFIRVHSVTSVFGFVPFLLHAFGG